MESAALPSHDIVDFETYRHEPLTDSRNQIRVLTLLPALNHEDAIFCELRVAESPDGDGGGDAGEYEAVSYVWGDASLTHVAHIDGRRLAITSNLDIALRYLRRTDRIRRLWIDGICIDQSNDREKSHQVQRLRSIFTRASQVLIWLGPGDDYTDHAIERLNELVRARHGVISAPLRWVVSKIDDEALHEGLKRIFARAWWTRVWTMVELLFASRSSPLFVCGRSWTPWLLDDSWTFGGTSASTTGALGASDRSRSYWSELGEFGHLLQYVSDGRATDPRDYVFAIAAFVPELMRRLGLPDYSLPVSVVYQRATVALITKGDIHSYRLQSMFLVTGSRHLTIPSWCVDFSATNWEGASDELDAITEQSGPRGKRRSDKETSNALPLEHDFDKGLLMLDGFELDRVHDVLSMPRTLTDACRVLADHDDSLDAASPRIQLGVVEKLLQDWIQLILPLRGKLLSRMQRRLEKQSASDAFAQGTFWATLTGGFDLLEVLGVRTSGVYQDRVYEAVLSREGGRRQPGNPWPSEHAVFAELERHFSRALSAASGTKQTLAAECVGRLSDADLGVLTLIALNLDGSALFCTEHGYFGRCPDRVQEGDILAVLKRSFLPVVLRSGDDGTYEYIAATNVQDILTDEHDEELAALEQKKFWLR